ncbi:hypothetical protein WA158_004413 [Blastocystis sp. Blastoise]
MLFALLAFGQLVCNSETQSDVTLSITGPLIGSYTATDSISLSFNYYVNSVISTSSNFCFLPSADVNNMATCEKSYTFTASQIVAGTATQRFCLPRYASNNDYNVIQVSPTSTVSGPCISFYDNNYHITYYHNCIYTIGYSPSFDEFFSILTQTPAVLLNARVSKISYIDNYIPFTLRPDIILSVASDSPTSVDATATYLGDIITVTDPLVDGLLFNEQKYYYHGTVSFTGDAATITSTNGNNENTKTVMTLSKFSCDGENSGKYPIIVTRVYSTTSYYEVFSISKDSTVIGSTISNDDAWSSIFMRGGNSVANNIYEHAFCFDSGDYSLFMSLYTSNSILKGESWKTDSYVTITSLSERTTNGISHDFNGHVIGDFAYFATYSTINDDSTVTSDVTVPFHVGPILCNEDEQVAVIHKLATTDGGYEGFSIYSLNKDTKETELIQTYYGFASINTYHFDPLFVTSICLKKDHYYSIKVFGAPTVTRQFGSYPFEYGSCSTWSTVTSYDSVVYNNIETNVNATNTYTSMLCTTITTVSSYYGEDIVETNTYRPLCSNEYSVMESDTLERHDIHNQYDCSYSYEVFISHAAKFTLYDNENLIIPQTSFTFMEENTYFFHFNCDDKDETNTSCTAIKDYQITCSVSTDNGVTKQDIACNTYGIVLAGDDTMNTHILSTVVNPLSIDVIVYLTVSTTTLDTVYGEGYSQEYSLTILKLRDVSKSYTIKQDEILSLPYYLFNISPAN